MKFFLILCGISLFNVTDVFSLTKHEAVQRCEIALKDLHHKEGMTSSNGALKSIYKVVLTDGEKTLNLLRASTTPEEMAQQYNDLQQGIQALNWIVDRFGMHADSKNSADVSLSQHLPQVNLTSNNISSSNTESSPAANAKGEIKKKTSPHIVKTSASSKRHTSHSSEAHVKKKHKGKTQRVNRSKVKKVERQKVKIA